MESICSTEKSFVLANIFNSFGSLPFEGWNFCCTYFLLIEIWGSDPLVTDKYMSYIIWLENGTMDYRDL